MAVLSSWRKSSQALAPARRIPVPSGQYDIYPTFPLGNNQIGYGFDSLAQTIVEQVGKSGRITIDGYIGVFWQHFRDALSAALEPFDIHVTWVDVSQALRSADANKTISAEHTRITLYRNGILVWGKEPGAAPAPLVSPAPTFQPQPMPTAQP